VFKDISLPQLLAGALAAATSLFLATKIGIAGSIIGVAVASIITTISTAVYKNILARTQDKIKDALPLTQEGAHEPAAETRAAHDAHLAQQEATAAAAAGELDATRAWGAPASSPATSTYAEKDHQMASAAGAGAADTGAAGAGATPEATQLMPQVAPEEPVAHTAGATTPLTPWVFSEDEDAPSSYASSEPYDNPYGDAAPVHDAASDPHVASPALIAAARARKRHEQVKMALVALVAALIGVAITAALVLYFTHGEGLGSTQTLLSMPSRVTTTQDDAAATTTTTPSATTGAAQDSTTNTTTSSDPKKDEEQDASSSSGESTSGTSGSHTGSSTEPSTSTDGSSTTGSGSNSTTGSSESTGSATGGSGTSSGTGSTGSAGSAGDASSTTGSTTPSTSPDTTTSDSSK
jgi:hypothetical protein